MKKGAILLTVAVVCGGVSVPVVASPPPSSAVLRVHTSIAISAHGFSVADTDFVVSEPASQSPRAACSIFGYTNASPNPGGGSVATTFYRGVATRRALANLQEQISALLPADMPAACSLESGSFTSGTYEITLYNSSPASLREIQIALNHSATEPVQCPPSVTTLVQLLNDFFAHNTHSIP